MTGSNIDEAADGLVLMDLIEVLRRRWILHVVGAACGVVLGVLALGTKEPSYRAEATLLLEQEGASAGILGDLAALTQAPVAISEMEILRSRSVATEVVRDPEGGLDALSSGLDELDSLGLATVVDDPTLRPLSRVRTRILGGAPDERGADTLLALGRLPDGEAGPLEFRISFPEASRVEIAPIGLLGAQDSEVFDFAPDKDIVAFGARLALRPTVDPTGRSWRVTLLSHEDALERVMDAVRVQETDRNSGVLRITYDDSDPERAARTVNALCRRYLERNLESSQRRASQTVGYIEESLEQQLTALRAAEAEVVALKASRPEFVDVGEAARALIEELAALHVRRVEAQIVRAGLAEAVELVRAGNLAALSRLGAEVADPVVLGYVESIVRLNAEAEVLQRSDTGAYKTLLQGHALELEAQRDGLALRLGTLEAMHERLVAGDLTVLGQLETAAQTGSADPILTTLVEQWTVIDGKLRKREVDFTDELPEIQSLRGERDALVARIAGVIGGRARGLAAQLTEYERLARERAEHVESLPMLERERITAAVDRLRERALEHLQARLDGMDAQDRLVGDQIDALGARMAELPENERILAAPMRAVVTHGELVQLLMMRQQEAEITKAASLASAEFIDAAAPPRRPTGPSLPMHLALGFLFGLGATTVWAMLRGASASGVFTSAELESAAGLPVIGTIPAYRKGAGKERPDGTLFVPLRDEPDGAVAEAFRALRSNLKFLIRSKEGGCTLAVTSSEPGEGKSMTNVDVALSFAIAGKRVLLVDADMRRGSVSEYLGIPPTRGLSDALQGSADWRSTLVASCHASMDVLPAGPVPASPGDLLASPRAATLIAEMRQDYDLVVFDVPPVLAVADIECVAAQLDTVLLLCRSAKTTDATVRHSVNRLRQVGANVVATVLNGVSLRKGAGGYGYGYGYGYGSNGSKNKEAA